MARKGMLVWAWGFAIMVAVCWVTSPAYATVARHAPARGQWLYRSRQPCFEAGSH